MTFLFIRDTEIHQHVSQMYVTVRFLYVKNYEKAVRVFTELFER